MARCKQCGTEIPEGLEYCDQCAEKLNTARDSESYLDSLLNAVMTEEPERREIVFPRKEASSPVVVSEKEKAKKEEEKEDSKETLQEPEEISEPFDFFAEEALPELKEYSIFDDTDEVDIDRMLEMDLREAEQEELLEEEPSEEEADAFDFLEEMIEAEESVTETMEEQPSEEMSEGMSERTEEFVEAEAFSDFADMFAEGGSIPETLEEAMPELFENDEAEEIMGDAMPEEDEVASAFGDFEEPAEEDAPVETEADAGLETLFSGLDGLTENTVSPEEEPEESVGVEASSDFADLFGDLGVDGDELFEFGVEPEEIADFYESEPISEEPPKSVGKEKEPEDEELLSGKKKEKKRNGFAAFFHKLFDNVKVDPSKVKPVLTKEELAEKKREAKEAKGRTKEEKESLLAEKKAQEQQEKAEKRRLVLEAKAEKKARKLEEAKLLLEEMEGTRINRAGASIVFIFFAMIAVVIVVGTSIFSYSMSIRNAQYEFDRDEYTLAYNEIYGLDIKEEDIVLYDRIMTVMYVQKQLNSYYNYYEMKDYPKALDSLLKGLQRYEKYIELAVELDIESDLDSVRNDILDELDVSFSMSEQEAMNIIQVDSQLEYSMRVYDATEGMEPEEETD